MAKLGVLTNINYSHEFQSTVDLVLRVARELQVQYGIANVRYLPDESDAGVRIVSAFFAASSDAANAIAATKATPQSMRVWRFPQ